MELCSTSSQNISNFQGFPDCLYAVVRGSGIYYTYIVESANCVGSLISMNFGECFYPACALDGTHMGSFVYKQHTEIWVLHGLHVGILASRTIILLRIKYLHL